MAIRSTSGFSVLRYEPGNPLFPTLPDGVQVPHVTNFGAGASHDKELHPLIRGRRRSTGPASDEQLFGGWQTDTTWVNPATIDFGTIPIPVQRTVTLYNARPIQITVTALNLPVGVTLLSPGLSVVLEPYAGAEFVLEASDQGEPSFDEIITFETSEGDVLSRVRGARLFTLEVFPQRPIIEAIRFNTALLRSKDATEKPYGLLRSPSSQVDYLVRFDDDTRRSRFRNAVMAGQSSIVVGAQKWYEARPTTSPSSGNTVFVNTDFGSFVIDEPISIVFPDGTELLSTVAAFDATTITTATALPTLVPTGSSVMPVGLGYFSKFPQYATYPVNAEDITYQVTFNRQAPQVALSGDFPLFETLPVLEDCNEIRGASKRGGLDRTEEVLDSRLSNRLALSTFPFGDDSQQFDLTLQSLAAIWKWREFFGYVDGSYGEIWVPTFRNDVTGVNIPSPDVTFDADNTGLSTFNQSAPREALRFLYPDGSIEYRLIDSVVDNDATESITITGANLPAGQPVVSILQRARILGDSAVFRHEQTGKARLAFTYRTIQK